MNSRSLRNTSIVMKVFEIFCFLGVIFYLVFLVASAIGFDWVKNFTKFMAEDNHGELSVSGFDIQILNNGEIIKSAQIAFALAGLFSFALKTMIFRNVYLTLRTADGKTSFSKGKTPFQKDTTRMVREIGYFYILIYVDQMILCIIFTPIIGTELSDISVKGEGLIAGFIILFLSQVFGYGEKLENEVEGLV